ncbi:MAG: hypothetical protein VX320_00775 [Candidatus Thermoplasmatota archaeon]|nr:hypothetical protein [Candidatus Thermoplasmatota archaeon]
MTNTGHLPWSPIDWEDPDGGIVRLWPMIPTVVLPKSLRRTTGNWDGIAYLLPDDEPEIWDEQAQQEKSSPGINRDGIIAGGGILSKMMLHLSTIDDIQACKFPDPESRRLLQMAESEAGKGSRPIFFVEPEDQDWIDWVEECADEMSRPRQLLKSIFSGRSWKKELLKSMRDATPPEVVREDAVASAMAEASGVAATWWRRSEVSLNEDLHNRRDERLAGRIRGALQSLREGQIDGDGAPVLLVPVMQAWMPSIHVALTNVEVEPLGKEVEDNE